MADINYNGYECTKDHSNIEQELNKLPEDQKLPLRHKCAGCAYEEGFKAGKNFPADINVHDIFNNLPYSQKGKQRHKDPMSAFLRGYEKGYHEYLKNKKP